MFGHDYRVLARIERIGLFWQWLTWAPAGCWGWMARIERAVAIMKLMKTWKATRIKIKRVVPIMKLIRKRKETRIERTVPIMKLISRRPSLVEPAAPGALFLNRLCRKILIETIGTGSSIGTGLATAQRKILIETTQSRALEAFPASSLLLLHHLCAHCVHTVHIVHCVHSQSVCTVGKKWELRNLVPSFFSEKY